MELLLTLILSGCILLFGFGLIYGLGYLLRLNRMFGHMAQFFMCILSFIVVLSFTYVAFGSDTVNYLMTGLFIGVGLALQPLIKTIMRGFIFDGTRLSTYTGEVEIPSKGVKGKVDTVGMLHTWLVDKNGTYYMVSNDLLSSEPLKIYPKNLKL